MTNKLVETKPEKRISFYEVPHALATIEQLIEDSITDDGEITCDPNALVRRDEIVSLSGDAVDWYVKSTVSVEAQTATLDTEIAQVQAALSKISEPFLAELGRLQKTRQARENRKEFNRTMIGLIFEARGVDKFILPNGKKVWTKTTSSVQIADDLNIDDLDPKFVRVKKEPDKVAIKKAFEAGEWTAPGIEIVERKTVMFPK